MNENHDDHGRFATAQGSTFMGAHDRLDTMAKNAHAKIQASVPPQFGTAKIGNRTVVTATKDGKTENWTQHKTAKAAQADAARFQRNHAEEHKYQMSGRARRGENARSYLATRAGRDAKYGKQLKLPF